MDECFPAISTAMTGDFLLLIHELDVKGYQTNTSMNVRKDVNECDRLEDRNRTSKPQPGRRAS